MNLQPDLTAAQLLSAMHRMEGTTPPTQAELTRALLHEGLKAAHAMKIRQHDLPGTHDHARETLDARGPHDPKGGLRMEYYVLLAFEQPVDSDRTAQQSAFQRLATEACKTAITP